ncbi:MAG TPA: hypothetical protein VGL94_12385 [Ktedonobacteraceae bacterium]|jgi:hypothetical protein
MRLIDAPGGPEIQAALKNEHVQKIVDILLQVRVIDKDFFEDIADFLQKCDGEMPAKKVAKKLRVLREYGFKSIDINGQRVLSSPSSNELFLALESLYNAEKGIINYRRGAIVELLTYKLVTAVRKKIEPLSLQDKDAFSHLIDGVKTPTNRCNSRCQDDECWSNQCLDNQSGRYRSKQVDVIVLLEKKYQIEGYSCKINIHSIKPIELIDIFYLSKEAKKLNYATHVGVVSFDHSSIIWQRLEDLSVPDAPHMEVLYFPEEITAYGLDNLSDLMQSPF